ncbi:MAG TPA: hypothetical protein VGO00_30380, partial [Kofleriaceae bacterium]|nr:hypothetical protein [Kofleriaceae bacterium]
MLRQLIARSRDAVSAVVERLRMTRRDPPRSIRYERFGAIVQMVVPRALVFVDRDYARRWTARDPAAWREPESALGEHPLTAPLEAHLQLTNRCAAGCKGCYTG